MIVDGNDIAHPKPSPDIFLLAAQKIGCPPDECVVIEDAASGILAARAAGAKTVYVGTMGIEADLQKDSMDLLEYDHLLELMGESEYTPFRSGHHYISKKQGDAAHRDPDRYNRYREQYEKWPHQQRLSEFPTHLDLELSSACNLHCPMCHTVYIEDPSFKKFKSNRMKEALMDIDLFKKAINEATQYDHFHSIKLNYRGESTLHPQIVDFIAYAKSKKVFEIMLNTNGNYDVELNQQMVEAGLTWLSISLDAINPGTYARVRAGGDFYRAYASAIDMCRFAGDVNCHVSFVKQKINFDEVDEFLSFWNKMPLKKILVSDVYNPGELIKNDSAFTVLNYKKSDKFTCPQLWQRILMFNDGRMFPCCHAFEAPDDLLLGDFHDVSIHEAWNSDKLQNMRRIHKDGDYQDIATCYRCAYPKQPVQLNVENIVGE